MGRYRLLGHSHSLWVTKTYSEFLNGLPNRILVSFVCYQLPWDENHCCVHVITIQLGEGVSSGLLCDKTGFELGCVIVNTTFSHSNFFMAMKLDPWGFN